MNVNDIPKTYPPNILISVVVIILLLSIAVYAAGVKVKSKLNKYSYLSAGDMVGSTHSIDFERDKDCVIITKFDAIHHSDTGVTVKYKAPLSAMEELKEVVIKYGMRRWPTTRKSKILACDAPTHYYSFSFSNIDESFSFNSVMDLPLNSAKGLRAIGAIEKKYMIEENKIK